mmetsp:Transcript_48929/g.97252  ORF Transcript_48929/g.97252 Transcript_48929/m.97252 type:complete len:92 (+) Transcript_48929:51-326(+)|eukprot:CAMPEP_0172712708 /NCGR_PEP_ID=MMETSP1074-20121228/61261_1 /TAXON_ID=2916 /ORGANISM="Ceratium fusus, Strain PA161109" /LENGTH=91 /DNA_ID=CAMNT_0013536679 /DNA_START=61 /DNA_END=336 /DNA_ORIENTATION=+
MAELICGGHSASEDPSAHNDVLNDPGVVAVMNASLGGSYNAKDWKWTEVSTQVVAGLNYKGKATNGTATAELQIFKPLGGDCECEIIGMVM